MQETSQPPKLPHTVGLTGGIACGKSTVCRLLAARGWRVIETDQLGRECLQPGHEGYKKVVDAFGPSILNTDKSVDRSRLGRIVFFDTAQRERLNSILHPIIRNLWQRQLQTHVASQPGIPAVVEIPLLFETAAEPWFARTVTVGCSPEQQFRRMRDRGWDQEEADRRLTAQWPLAEKMKQSDHVIWNDGTPALLQAQLERIPV
ncbi:MAG: dephospho-CoA kinase [Candidatus Methylacidiphilales bacterium]|nr:dephospho-CoA kinase [Candidatus Methylacidiphilales bacterium]